MYATSIPLLSGKAIASDRDAAYDSVSVRWSHFIRHFSGTILEGGPSNREVLERAAEVRGQPSLKRSLEGL
jgi:hypothetical protein